MSEAMLLARKKKMMVRAAPAKPVPPPDPKIYGMEISLEQKVKEGKLHFLTLILC